MSGRAGRRADASVGRSKGGEDPMKMTSWERGPSARSALQVGVFRVDFAVEQSPVEGVHLRGGRCVPGQDRGHNGRHVIWDMTSNALDDLLVAGEANSRHAVNPGLTTPHWQYTGTSNRFAVEPGLASSRSVNGMRLANTGTPSTSRTTEGPPTPTLARPSPRARQARCRCGKPGKPRVPGGGRAWQLASHNSATDQTVDRSR